MEFKCEFQIMFIITQLDFLGIGSKKKFGSYMCMLSLVYFSNFIVNWYFPGGPGIRLRVPSAGGLR